MTEGQRVQAIAHLRQVLEFLTAAEPQPAVTEEQLTTEDLRNWLKQALEERTDGKPEKMQAAQAVIVNRHGHKNASDVPVSMLPQIMRELDEELAK